jgi:DNA-binding MarR family transcriptional regulator
VRRYNIITITPAGTRRLGRLGQLVAEVQEKLLAPLSRRERQTLVRMLTRVLEHHAAG